MNPPPEEKGMHRRFFVVSKDGRLPHLRLRVGIMTAVIFAGWVYFAFISNVWCTDVTYPCWMAFATLPYLPMLLGSLLVAGPLDYFHASQSWGIPVFGLYGFAASYLYARILYWGWKDKKEP